MQSRPIDLKLLLFPDNTPFHELTSLSPELMAGYLNFNPCDNIYFNNLSDQDYDEYFDTNVHQWNISVLGISRLSAITIEKLFYVISNHNKVLNTLGLDYLSDESINIIYGHVISLIARNFFINMIFGPTISNQWKSKFDGLSNPAVLIKELTKLTKSLYESHIVDRIIIRKKIAISDKLTEDNDALNIKLRESLKEINSQTIKLVETKESLAIIKESEEKLENKIQVLAAKLKTVKDGLSAKVAELKTVKDELSAKEVDLKTLKDGLSAKEAELKTVKDGLSAKEAELKTVKDGLSAKEAEHITVKAGLSAKVAELKTVNDELIATKMQLSTREGEFREAKEYIIDLSDRFQIVSNTLQQLRQTGLFSAEKRERDITEEKAEEAYPENKRQKFSDQELQIANNLLILNSSSSTDATTEPLDEKLEQNSVPATGRGLKRKLKKKLLEIFSNHLDVKQPESQLKLYIENQITTCEKIFTDGRPFTEIKDTEVTALLYYICYVVCNLHQHRAETNLPLSVSVCQYFANTIYTRIDDRKSLLHTLNRMSDGVINTTEANMYLRAERSVLDTHVEQLKQAGQTLQSQLLQAQTDIGALNLTKQLLLTSEAELKTLKVKSAKQTAILTKTQTVIKTLSQKIPFIPTDIFNEIIAIQQQITDVEPNIATGAGHSPSIYPFNSFAVPSVFSLTASPFLLFHQRTSSSLPTPMTSNVLATQNNP